MEDSDSASSRSPEQLEEFRRSEDGCIRSPIEVDYLQLCFEATKTVQRLTSPERSSSLHLNQAQCRLLADALSEAVQSAKQDVRGLDPASVRLFAPAFRELCRVAGDCEKLVRDCCKQNWLPVVLMLADRRQEFLLRVSELKWCARAWRTVKERGLQGGAWLKQFHKSSQMSVADRSSLVSREEAARLRTAFEEDVEALRAKLAEMQGNVDVGDEVRELAGYVLRRCEMIGAVRRSYNEQERSEYELPGTRIEHSIERLLGSGASASVLKMRWFGEDFAAKVTPEIDGYSEKEVAAMIKVSGHPRIVQLLGLLLPYPNSKGNAIVMELMPSDLRQLIVNRNREGRGGECMACGPFPLHVAVDIMLQVVEGVEVLHKVQLFHRDLKPGNVLVEHVEVQALRDEGYVRVKLADFGSTEARSRSFGEVRVGTTMYMAPEIGFGSEDVLVYPAKADAFSFAMLCHEVLSGRSPYDFGEQLRPSTLRWRVLGGLRPELPAALPSQIASLVQRCSDTEPTKRPTIAAICKELRYLKFLITIGGEVQFRALDVPDKDGEMIADIVKQLRWIDLDQEQLGFVRHIGSGGYGSVDECAWQGGRVAVKNLWRVGKEDVGKEAALLVRVEHPNVVKVIGCAFKEGEEKGMIVMELMEQDLHHLIKEKMRGRDVRGGPPFSLSVALEIVWKVATAMKHVRSCNVLHRDLKTTNILVNMRTGSQSSSRGNLSCGVSSASRGEYYDVKLADFGLSKLKSKGSRFTTRASEARHWRAPETSKPGNYSWPADVFSFGVVCYEVLSGEVPFGGMPGPELERSVREGKRPEIPAYCPKVLIDLVNACWATNPEDRPEFAEICLKLEACMSDNFINFESAVREVQ